MNVLREIWSTLSGNFILGILVQVCYYVILSESLNLILGYGGMFNIGHAAFFAIGSYVSALVSMKLGLPFLLELIIAGCSAGLIGLIVGFPAIRLKGDYLCFLTYSLAITVHTICRRWTTVTNGDAGLAGIPKVALFKYFGFEGIRISKTWMFLLLSTAIVTITLFTLNRIINSPFGRTIESIREDEIAALACGRNVSKIRVILFCVGAFFAGVAGVLYAHYYGVVDPTGFTTNASSIIMQMVLIGGMGSFAGAISGAIIVTCVPELLRLLSSACGVGIPIEHIKNIIFSVLLIVIILKRPQGLFGKLKF